MAEIEWQFNCNSDIWVTSYILTIYELLVKNGQYMSYKLNKNNIQVINNILIIMYELLVACKINTRIVSSHINNIRVINYWAEVDGNFTLASCNSNWPCNLNSCTKRRWIVHFHSPYCSSIKYLGKQYEIAF